MKWNVQLSPNDFSAYEFTSEEGRKLFSKYNRNQGSFRMKCNEQYGVLLAETTQLNHRKFTLSNVYGSEIGMLTKNLWHENTGNIMLTQSGKKLHYKIDTYSSFIEINCEGAIQYCDLKNIPHPGREMHYMPILIALGWLYSVPITQKMESAT